MSNRREPVLYFHTSNTEKFLQARILAQMSGVRLTQFIAGAEPYDEDYELSPRDMLRQALDQAVRAAGRSSLVFVEDTTVRIEALSSVDHDFPGLATKEWFSGSSQSRV
jgi:inosine/xanthosine triphosphate pyrophosphatase family protein